ncbi:MAG TPA: copper homeostasis protein CutC [Gemmatimonadaceae bacterium]
MTSSLQTSVLLEACIESPTEGLAAQRAGAGRLELCAGLIEGGTTPSAGMMNEVVERVAVPVFVMVRPRGGGFTYSADELGVMCRDIIVARTAGARGIVTGSLARDRTIDRVQMQRLLDAARPAPVTFHRAFDVTLDLEASLDVLLDLGVDRVLTSGGAPTALAGAYRIAALVSRAGKDLTVLAGGGVRAPDVRQLVRRTSVREVHARPVRPLPEDAAVGLPALPGIPAGGRSGLDADGIRAMAEALAG